MEVTRMARENTPMVMKRLANIVHHSKNEHAVVAAAKILLDRGWGQAPATITLNPERDPTSMSDAELNQALAEYDDRLALAARCRTLQEALPGGPADMVH